MALFDELDKQTWRERSRLARERLGISASVEAALEDETFSEDLEDDWSQLESPSEMSPRMMASGPAVIPPRLSLQSKPMMAVRREAFSGAMVGASEASVQSQQASSVSAEQNANVLLRLAHRITASLSSIGSALQPSAIVPPVSEEVLSAPAGVETPLPMSPAPMDSTSQVVGMKTMNLSPSRPKAPVIPKTPVIVESRPLPAPPARPAGRLGRTTKVRLRTAPKPEKIAEAGLNTQPEARKEPPSELQAGPQLPPEAPARPTNTSAHLPIVKVAGSQTSASGVLFGSGQFEGGQSDTAVSEASIEASNVVVVMLTGDPGPVVVQYISLQPGIGFTIHLSAATMKQTPFNYVVLRSQS